MSDNSPLTVIIPAYNEAESLKTLLPVLAGHCAGMNWKIIVVNDGSGDNTREILDAFTGSGPLTVVHHKLNRGYGASIKSGISLCDTEYCITIDADGQHRPEDIERLFNCIRAKDADMVVGSRKGTRSVSVPRGIGKGIIRLVAKILMHVPVHDINSGMKIYRVDLAREYVRLAPDTMSYSDIITLIFINNRHLVLEEPITVNTRTGGKSTVGVETAFQTVMEVLNIVILFNPMKIFLPLSLLCILLTLIWGIPLMVMGRGVSTGTVLGIVAGLIFFLLGLIAEQLSLIRRKLK